MTFVMLRPYIYLFLILNFFILKNSFALDSLSYSGRLVQTNGAPVTGTVTLKADLAYTNALTNVLCTKTIPGVVLTKGVFHIKLDFDCSLSGLTLNQVLSQVPNGESVAIQITDVLNSKSYSFQAIHAMPFANVASQLVQMGASSGQALIWDGSKWAPSPVGTGNGTVSTVNTGTGLTGGPISTSGTISIANSGVGTTQIANNAVTAAKINSGEITNSHLSATAAIDYSKLNIGAGEIPQDRINGLSSSLSSLIEDVINDAVTGKAPSQNAVFDALALKSDRTNVAQNITAASVTGLTAPMAGSDATNKTYVDNAASTVDTRLTNEVSTLNTSIGNKYDKAGGVITGDVTVNTQTHYKGGSNFTTVKANASTSNYTLTLPVSAGTSGYVLATDGSGNTSWVTPAVGSSTITDGSITDADVNSSAAIAQSKIANLTTDLGNKEPTITAGTATQYWKGNKTWASLQTDVQALVLSGFTSGANSSLLNTDTVVGAFGKVQGQIDTINTTIAGKEASLTAGTTAQFYRGDKSWQTLNGGAVANTPAGTIAATTTQNAINELDTEKQDKLISTSVIDNRELRFYELPGNGTFYSSIKSPDDLTANINYTLPVTAPTAGQVLSSNASGVMNWISIPSAPVTTVFGRSGTVAAANGDYTASQVTNVPAGSIAATDVQTALNELATEKEPALTNPSDTTKYYRGDKTWSTFATDAINSVLSTFAVGTGTKPTVTNTDSVVGAFGKVQKSLNDINSDYVSKSANNTVTGSFNISGITSFIQVPTPTGSVVNEAANVQYVHNYVGGYGQWTKSASDIYFNTGNVGVGTSTPARRLDVVAPSGSTAPLAIRTNDFASGTTGTALFVDFGAASGNTFTKISTGSAGGSTTSNLILQGSGGNVGINTTTPNATLDVNGTIRVQQICDSTGGNCKTVSSGWGNVAAASMVANWPDAIVCDNGTDKSIMYHDTKESGANLEYYSKPSASHQLRFNATTGAFYDNTAFTGNSACVGKSINTLISEGRTFGLLGGGVDWTPNGANVYRAGGDIGLGTSTPSYYQHGGTNRIIEIHNSGTAINSQNHIVFSTGSTVATSSIGTITGAVSNSTATNKGVANVAITTGANSTATAPTGEVRISTRGASDTNWAERVRVSETGNVGVGTTTPTAKLDVAGDIKATSGGTIGVTRVLGTFGNTTLNITNGNWTYVGDFISLPAGSWIVYYENFYDHDGTTPFSFNSYNHPFLSTNTSNTGSVSQGNLNACSNNYCPIKSTYQVTVASTTTYYIVHLLSGYSGSYARLRNWGNFYALKVN